MFTVRPSLGVPHEAMLERPQGKCSGQQFQLSQCSAWTPDMNVDSLFGVGGNPPAAVVPAPAVHVTTAIHINPPRPFLNN